MKYLQPKSPSDTRFYTIDYSKNLPGDQIASISATVSIGTISINQQLFSGNLIGLMLGGGVNGETATIDLIINSVSGQILTDQATQFIVDGADDIDFAVVTKQQIVEYAFQDIRLSGYTYDHSADETSAMLSRLDSLMREWRLFGRDTGYNHPKNIGLSNLNDIAGIPDGLMRSVATLLAYDYMDGIGKTATPSLVKKHTNAYNRVYAYCKSIPVVSIPRGTPRGAGNKIWNIYAPFFLDNEGGINSLRGQFISIGIWDQSIWG